MVLILLKAMKLPLTASPGNLTDVESAASDVGSIRKEPDRLEPVIHD